MRRQKLQMIQLPEQSRPKHLTWTYNDHIVAQLRWCGGLPPHHVTSDPPHMPD